MIWWLKDHFDRTHTLSLTRMDKQKCWCNPLKKPRIVIKHSHSKRDIVVQLRIKTVINYLIKLSHGGRSRCVVLNQQNRVDWLWNSKTEFTYIHRCVCGVCIRMSFAFCHSFYGDCWCWWFRFHWSKLVSEASKRSKQVCLPSSMRVQNWICKILNVSLNKSTHPVSFSLSLSYFGRFCSHCFVLPLYACVSLCVPFFTWGE